MKVVRRIFSAVALTAVLASSCSQAQTTLTLSTTEQALLDLAVELYPALFSNGSALGLYQGYTYKYFADSKVYVGFKDGHVYLMGGAFGSGITDKGLVSAVQTQLQTVKAQQAPQGTSGGNTTVITTAAALVISAASPASLNGTLNKAGAQFETGASSAQMTSYNSSDPYCRIAAYTMKNSGNGKNYSVEISFSKADGSVGVVKFAEEGNFAAIAQASGPLSSVTIDISNRRIAFANTSLSGTGTSFVLNGTLEYPTNFTASNRPSCG